MAVSAWKAVRDGLSVALSGCASGRELIAAGYQSDVSVAAEVDESAAVPVLHDGRFIEEGACGRL